MIKTYIPDNLMSEFNPILQENKISQQDIRYVENGAICIDYSHGFGAVYDDNGRLCDASILYRGDGHAKLPKYARKTKFINEKVVFAGSGFIFFHFGHFLCEGAARLYPALYKKFQGLKYAFVVGHKTKQLPTYVLKFLAGLGIPESDIILVKKSTRFAGVYVPPQASVIVKSMSPVMAKVFDKVANKLEDKKIKTYDKIYVSRSHMDDGRTFGEESIENIFKKNGYKIIYPELLPFPDQITLVHNCKVLAGAAGTALHSAVFMKPGNTVIQIKRNTKNNDNFQQQYIICKLKHLKLIHVAGSIENIPTNHFTQEPQILGITPQLQEFFNDYKFKYSKQDIEFDTIAWTQYEQQWKKYKQQCRHVKRVKPFARILSFFGITRYGREFIRESIMRLLHAMPK